MKKRRFLQIPIALIAVATLATIASNAFGQSAARGVQNGQLGDLDASRPNNVASYAAGAYPKMEPIRHAGDKQAAKQKLISLINDMPRTEIVTDEGDYLHATFTSRIFRFVDDVEFLIEDDVIQYRSSSRVGYSDMGANETRMKEIKQQFEQ